MRNIAESKIHQELRYTKLLLFYSMLMFLSHTDLILSATVNNSLLNAVFSDGGTQLNILTHDLPPLEPKS